jgi:hypothetical protein
MSILISLVVAAAGLVLGATEEPLTITGTPSGVTVVEPGGGVEHFTSGQLQLLNQERVVEGPQQGAEEAPEKVEPAEEAEPAEPLPEVAEETPAPPEAEVKELTPEQLAKKQAAMAEIQAARQLGGAYFYTEDDRPIPATELTQMLESGEIPNIKVVDLFQQRRVYDFKAIEEGDASE